MLAAAAADADWLLTLIGVPGGLLAAGGGFVSAGYSLSWLIHVASG